MQNLPTKSNSTDDDLKIEVAVNNSCSIALVEYTIQFGLIPVPSTLHSVSLRCHSNIGEGCQLVFGVSLEQLGSELETYTKF
jgi:hypothetical protein